MDFISSSQDGGEGRTTLLHLTTKRKITTNLKTINYQNFQNRKLHGTPTTKELKKHSSRQVGGVETGSQVGREDPQEGSGPEGEEGLADQETEDSKPLAVKYSGRCEGGRNAQSHRRPQWKVGLLWSQQSPLFPL